MADDERQANVVLTSNNAQYDQAMAASAQQTQNLESAVDSLGTKLDRLAKTAGRKLQFFGLGDVAAITATAAAYGSFEKQMEGLQAQAQALNKTTSEGARTFAGYQSSVNSLRKEFPVTTQEAAALVRVISQLGDSTTPIDKVAASFTKLSGATGESSASLAAGVLQLSRQMGNGTKDIENYNNTILQLSANSGQTASSLVSFASTLAPAGRQLKISQTDILGISSAFGKAGQDGNLAANAFNKMANDISSAIQSGSPDLAKYANLIGKTQDQLRGMDKTDALVEIFSALNAQGPDAIRTLERFGLEGQRNLRAIQAVTQQSGGLGAAVNAARAGFSDKDASALNRSSQDAFDGLFDQTRKFSESMKKNAETFGAPFAGIADEFLKGATTMTNAAGIIVDGPVGKMAQVAAGIVAPFALAAGTLLTFAKSLSTVAAIRFVAGSGLTGFMDQYTGRDPKGVKNPRSWFQRGLYNAGSAAGGAASRFRREDGPGLLSQAAGVPFRIAAAGTNMLADSYSPAWYGFPGKNGYDDPTQRKRMITNPSFRDSMLSGGTAFTERMRQTRDAARGRLTENAADQGRIAGPRLPSGNFLKATDEMAKASSSAAKEVVGLGGGVKTLGGSFARLMGSLALASGGAAKMGAGLIGRGAGALGIGPLGLGLAGVAGGMYAYDKFFTDQDKSQAQQFKDTSNILAPYADKAGVGAPAMTFSAENVVKERETANTPKSMAQALRVSNTDSDVATAPGRKYTNKVVGQIKTVDEGVARLSAQYAAMGNVSPEVYQQLKYDLLKNPNLSPDQAQEILSKLQTNGGPNYGNIAAGNSMDPMYFLQPAFSGGNRKEISTGVNQYVQNTSSRQAVAAQTGGNQAGYAQGRSDISKLLKDTDKIFNNRAKQKAFAAIAASYGEEVPTGMLASTFDGSPEKMAAYLLMQDKTGQFKSDLGIKANDKNALSKIFGTQISLTSGGRGSPEQELYNRRAKIAGEQTTSMFQDNTTTGTMAMSSVQAALSNPDNVNKQITAIDDIVAKMQSQGQSYDQIDENLRKFQAAVGDATDPLYTLAGSARQIASQRQDYTAPMQSMGQRSDIIKGRYDRLKAAQTNGTLDPNTGEQDLNAAEQARVADVQQEYDLRKQIFVQYREFSIQQQESEYQFGLQRQRAWDDFSLQRNRSEHDFQLQRTRAVADYNLQEKYQNADFNKSRMRQEQDFNHQREIQAEASAKQMYNIYERVQVQRTMSGSNLLSNGQDQLQRLQGQSANLDKARNAGVSDQVIQQLGLTDAANSQQLQRFVDDITNNPALVKQFNDQIKARIAAAKKVVEDDSSTEWQELTRQYKLGRERAQDDFDLQQDRSRKAFKKSLDRQNVDFATSMDRQAEDMGKSMDRASKDFAHSEDVAKEALDRSVTDLFSSGEELLDTATDTMDKGAKNQYSKIMKTLAHIGTDGAATIAGINKMWEKLSPGGSNAKAESWNDTLADIGKIFTQGSDGGSGGMGGSDGHEHSPTCGHMGGGSGLPPMLSMGGSGGPDIGASKDSTKKDDKWQYPMPGHKQISSPYGMRRHPIKGTVSLHDGNDFPAPLGTPYGAPHAGVVRSVQNTQWGGRVPYVDHGNGLMTFYGHSSALMVNEGQKLMRGQRIGSVGSVGFSTGPHLHFGATQGGRPFNSMALLGGAVSGKVFGSGTALDAVGQGSLDLNKRYEKIEKQAHKLDYTAGRMSDAINDPFVRAAKAADVDITWHRNGGIFAGAGPRTIGIGEGGSPEIALPLNNQGVQFLSQLMEKQAPRNNAVGATPVQSTTYHQYRVDKSTNFSGAITVVSNDPNEFLRKMEQQKRMAALTQPVLAGVR